jgi:hypothetical protein
LIYKGRSGGLPSTFNTSIRDANNNNGYDVKFTTDALNSGYLKNASSGDIDGDGYYDLIISNIGQNASTYGKFYVLFGDSSISGDKDKTSPNTLVITGNSQGYGALSLSEDINNDGAYDILIEGGSYDVYKYLGVLNDRSSVLDNGSMNNSSYSNFGINISMAGDINFDNFKDIVFATGSKALLLYQGTNTGLSSQPLTIVSKDSGSFGIRVSGTGYYNTDKFSDIITVDRTNSILYVIK